MITNTTECVFLVMLCLFCLWQPRDTLSEDLPALLELPLTLEQGPTASTHTTTVEETDQISGLDEDLQRYQLTLILSLYKAIIARSDY